MDAELVKFIAVFVMPLAFSLWAIGRRFDGHDKEIIELKKRINKLENKND